MEVVHRTTETFSTFDDSLQAGSSVEGKIAKDLAKEFIFLKVGRPLKKSPRRECEILIRLSDEIEKKYEMLMKNMCNRLTINPENVYKTFIEVATEIFVDGCKWGRIVVLYAFGGELAKYCVNNNMEHMVDKIVVWLGSFVARKADWIREEGGGWNGFVEQFKDVCGDAENFWFRSLLATTVGLGTLAAAFYIKS